LVLWGPYICEVTRAYGAVLGMPKYV
jgi:hypothetical protein